MLPENDPAAVALRSSVCDLGRILEPLKVCGGRIVDGRERQRAALVAGLDEVPTVEVAEEEVTTIILHSLLARRHLTKSARAYLAFPLLEPALAASRNRRLANLRPGGSGKRTATPSAVGDTSEEMAEQLGVCRRLIFMAREIHKKFNTGPKSLRETWEPKLLSGELDLGAVQQAISGKFAALDGKTHPKNDPEQLLFEGLETLTLRFGHWKKIAPDAQEKLIEVLCQKLLPALPSERLAAVEKHLRSLRLSHAA